jgi:hypothetical protein
MYASKFNPKKTHNSVVRGAGNEKNPNLKKPKSMPKFQKVPLIQGGKDCGDYFMEEEPLATTTVVQ